MVGLSLPHQDDGCGPPDHGDSTAPTHTTCTTIEENEAASTLLTTGAHNPRAGILQRSRGNASLGQPRPRAGHDGQISNATPGIQGAVRNAKPPDHKATESGNTSPCGPVALHAVATTIHTANLPTNHTQLHT